MEQMEQQDKKDVYSEQYSLCAAKRISFVDYINYLETIDPYYQTVYKLKLYLKQFRLFEPENKQWYVDNFYVVCTLTEMKPIIETFLKLSNVVNVEDLNKMYFFYDESRKHNQTWNKKAHMEHFFQQITPYIKKKPMSLSLIEFFINKFEDYAGNNFVRQAYEICDLYFHIIKSVNLEGQKYLFNRLFFMSYGQEKMDYFYKFMNNSYMELFNPQLRKLYIEWYIDRNSIKRNVDEGCRYLKNINLTSVEILEYFIKISFPNIQLELTEDMKEKLLAYDVMAKLVK